MIVLMTVHEELIQTVETLTEEQARALLQVARVMRPGVSTVEKWHVEDEIEVVQPVTWEEGLARARALRLQLEQEIGMFPDIVEMINKMRGERLNDILNSMR